jgi:hypothetical protein
MTTGKRTEQTEGDMDARVDRRSVLRRAAAVAAAGIGGVAAVEMLSAGPASAAVGTMQYGTDNDAGNLQTTLTSTISSNTGHKASTLLLSHTSNGAPLAVAPQVGASWSPSTGSLVGGELINLSAPDSQGITSQSLFWMTGDNSTVDSNGSNLDNLAVVLTTATGTVFAPVGPSRLLDTRYASMRHRILKPSVLNSHGQLIGKQVLELDLSDIVSFAWAIHFNLTATVETGTGFLTAFGSQDSKGNPAVPTASNLNFHENLSIANSGLSPLSSNLSLYIYASTTTHVILDVQGWTLPDFSFLLEPDATAAAATAKASPQRSAAAAVRSIPRRASRG